MQGCPEDRTRCTVRILYKFRRQLSRYRRPYHTPNNKLIAHLTVNNSATGIPAIPLKFRNLLLKDLHKQEEESRIPIKRNLISEIKPISDEKLNNRNGSLCGLLHLFLKFVEAFQVVCCGLVFRIDGNGPLEKFPRFGIRFHILV